MSGNDAVVVLLNFSGGPLKLDPALWGVKGGYKDIFTMREVKFPAAIEVGPWGYAVLEKERG